MCGHIGEHSLQKYNSITGEISLYKMACEEIEIDNCWCKMQLYKLTVCSNIIGSRCPTTKSHSLIYNNMIHDKAKKDTPVHCLASLAPRTDPRALKQNVKR